MTRRTLVLDVVGLTSDLLDAGMPNLQSLAREGAAAESADAGPVFISSECSLVPDGEVAATAVDTLASAVDLLDEVGSSWLGLTMDIGHVRCSETCSEPEAIERHAPLLRNVHIEDIAGREHSHRMFGEGDLEFGPILAALTRVKYSGLVGVELSRDSHRAPEVAAAALAFLKNHVKASA